MTSYEVNALRYCVLIRRSACSYTQGPVVEKSSLEQEDLKFFSDYLDGEILEAGKMEYPAASSKGLISATVRVGCASECGTY